MPITGHGWEFHVQRLGMHRRGDALRTYGSYRVLVEGAPAPPRNGIPLAGFVCETKGPGRNHPQGNGLRIEQGRYPITTQFGKYVSIGYSTDTQVAAQPHMPAVALTDTDQRTGILIHPGHPAEAGDPPFAFVSSIGCFNLTKALQPADDIEYFESRARVIALIDSLAEFGPGAFHDAHGNAIKQNTLIPRAFAVVDGEPMNILGPTPVVVAQPLDRNSRDSMGTG
jgi:hypothetical protein